MHYRLLITLDAGPDATSEAIRHETFERLSQDDSFCGQGGRFNSPICDWFVIGGRWSGYLAEALIGEAYRRDLIASLPGFADIYTESYAQENAETIGRIWAAHGGTGLPPHLRDSYDMLGAEDDAKPLTRELYEQVLRDYHGESEHFLDGCEYADLECESLTEDAIGRKWLVVVDYHN